MSLKSFISFLSVLVATATLITVAEQNVRTQTPKVPNLGGTWELVEYNGTRKSDLGSKFPEMKLSITQAEAELTIVQNRMRNGVEEVVAFKYYLDGRGETNAGRLQLGPRDDLKWHSVTQLKGNKLLSQFKEQVFVGTSSSGRSGSYSTTDTADTRKDEWQVASNGETLTLRSSAVQVNSASITSHQPAPGGGLDDRGEMSSRADRYKLKYVFKKVQAPQQQASR